jgi:tetratricopeptide (TPR) repeat protein
MQREPPRRTGPGATAPLPTFEAKLEREEEVLDALVTALARGQLPEGLWSRLHEAAVRDERVSELAFAYEAFAQNRRLKMLAPAVIAELMFRAATFFEGTFGDEIGATTYYERALAALPGHAASFERLSALLTKAGDGKRLADAYVAQAQHRTRGEQITLLYRAAELVDQAEGGDEKATEIYTQLLRLDPGDVRAREALEEKYLRANRHRDVARLLEQALATEPPPDEEQSRRLRTRLLELYATQLHEPERTMPHVEALLAREPGHEDARRIAAKLLAIKGLAARAAAALADAYEQIGTAGDVAKYLAVELEHTRGPKRLTVLTRLGTLKQDRLNDPQGAYEALEQALALDPSEDELRARYATLALKLGKALEAARTLSRVGTVAKEAHVRARLSAEMGELLAAGGDTRRARATFVSVLSTASADPVAVLRAARALAEIHQAEKDPKALADVLSRIAEVEPDPSLQRQTLERLAELSTSVLGDTPRAIAAWRKLVDTSSRARALAALEPLYEAAGQSDDLSFVLEERGKDARDPAEARSLAVRAAEVLSRSGDAAKASAAWERVVEKFGASRDVHAHLLPLLEAERRWAELAVALAAEAQLAPESERAAILARLGVVRLQRTREIDLAIDAFRRALSIDAAEKTSRGALEKLLVAGEHRLLAAAVLEPLYRAEDSTAGLLRVLDLKAQLSAEPDERLGALAEATDTAARSTTERGRAIELAARGLEEAAASGASLEPWLSRVDRLAEGVDPKRLAALVGKALGDRPITSQDLLEVARRLGEALAKSGDVASALAVYRRALDFEPSSGELVSRVDELLREQGNPAERVALYRSALARGVDPRRRRDLLHAIGAIEREDLKNLAGAIAAYASALEDDDEDRDAHAALVDLLEETGDVRAMCDRLEARLARSGGDEAIAIRARIAAVAAAHDQPDRARTHARALLDEKTLDASALDVVEGVASRLDDVALARAVLERRAAEAGEPREQIQWLVKLGALESGGAGDAAATWKRAAGLAESTGDDALARELYEKVRAIAPGDRDATRSLAELLERVDSWEALPALYDALLEGSADAAEAAGYASRAARTLETRLGDAAGAMRAARRAFLLTPRDRDALATLERLALAAGAPAELAEIVGEAEKSLSRGEDETGDGALRADLALTRARALASDPATFDLAVAAHRALLEGDTLDEGRTRMALGALEGLLPSSPDARVDDWRWLFAWRATHGADAERPATLLAWASAEESRLGDPERALALHHDVLAIDPENADAMAAVARIALSLGHVDEAVAALGARRDRSEGAARIALDLEIATVLLERATRLPEALACVAAVLESAPQDASALALSTRLLAPPETRAATITMLERTLESVEDPEVRAQVLTRLLDTPTDASSRELRRGWFERLLELLTAEEKSELGLATVLRAAEELPDVDALWDRAEELARALHRPDEVSALYGKTLDAPMPHDDALALGKRAVAFHEEWYEDPDRVVRILERILEIDPTESWAFDRLKLLFDASARWDDLFALFDRALLRVGSAGGGGAGGGGAETKRIELLEDAAQIAKDFASRPERAIGYLEQLIAMRPDDARLSASLERLYERHDRHRELVMLLGARLPQLPAREAQATRARIAGLWLNELGDAAAALQVVEDLLARGVDASIDLSGLLERILAVAPPYAELREPSPREGARDSAPPPAATDGASAPAERTSRPSAVPPPMTGPKRTLVRQRAAALLKERYVESGRDADLVRVLEVELEAVKSVKERIRRHRQLAELYVNLGSDEEAIEHYVSLVTLEPDVVLHREQLAQLARRTGKDERLAEVLVTAADDCTDDALRVDLLMHAASVHEVPLADAPRAIDLYFRVLSVPADDALHLVAARRLAPLLEASDRSRERLEVLERTAILERDPSARREALGRVAELASTLGEHERAIAAWTRRLDEGANDHEALAGLVDLLGRERRWRALIDVLGRRAEASDDPDARRADRVRIAETLSRELGATDEAILAWEKNERDLGETPESTAALAALLEGAERWSDLTRLLARSAAGTLAGEARSAVLSELGDVQRERLGENEAAIASYREALDGEGRLTAASARARAGLTALLASDTDGGAALDVLLSAHARSDEWRQTLALTEHRLRFAPDGDARVRVLREAGATASERASDLDAAFAYARRAFLLAPSRDDLTSDLVQLAAATHQWRPLADAQKDALEAAGSSGGSWVRALRLAMGEVLETRLDDARGALAAYLRVVSDAPGDMMAVKAVIRVAGRVMRWDAAAKVVVDHACASGEVDATMLDAIEQGATSPLAWDAVTAAFAAAVAERGVVPVAVGRALEARVAAWQRDRRGDPEAAEAAFARALAYDPSNAGLLGELAQLQRGKKGRPLVDSLLRLSHATGGDLDLLREAADVAAESVGDRGLAKSILERLLRLATERWRGLEDDGPVTLGSAASPSSYVDWGLHRLVRIHEEEGDAERVVELLVETSRLPFDRDRARAMRHDAARIASGRVGDVERAVTLYGALFDEDTEDARAVEGLVTLLEGSDRRADLLELRRKQVRATKDGETRLTLRLEVARLEHSVGDTSASVAALRANLEEDPRHAPTVAALTARLEAEGREAELASLLADQAQRAEDAAEIAKAADLWSRAARVADELGDPDAATARHERVIALEPRAASLDALARLAAQRGAWAKAAEHLEALLERAEDSERAAVAVRLAESWVNAGNPERARARLEEASAADPDAAVVGARLTTMYREGEEWNALAALLTRSAAHAPDKAARLAALREAAELYRTRCGTPDLAIPLLEQASDLEPEDRTTKLALADALGAAERYAEARSLLRALVDGFGGRRPKERAPVHYHLARLDLAMGDSGQALVELDAATRIDPANPEILRTLAELARSDGQMERAERSYRALLAVLRRVDQPAADAPIVRSEVLLELASIATLQGEKERAAELLESALEAASRSDVEGLRLEEALRAKGELTALARALEARIARGGAPRKSAEALTELATLLDERLGQREAALTARLRAVALAPELPSMHDAALDLARRMETLPAYVEHLAALAAAAEARGDETLACELSLRVGDVVERELHDDAGAAAHYERAQRFEVRLPDVLCALDRIYERLGDVDAQARVLARRVEIESMASGAPATTDALYRLATLKLLREGTLEEGCDLLLSALAIAPELDRAEAALRAATEAHPRETRLIDLYERVGRTEGHERALVEALTLRSQLPGGSPEPLREAVSVARHIGDARLAESLLRRLVGRGQEGAPDPAHLAWALTTLAELREADDDVADAVALKRQAAELAEPEEARRLRFEVARLAADRLYDLTLAASTYEELHRHEPADRDAWELLLEVYRRMGKHAELADLIGRVVDFVDDNAERSRLRLERVRVTMNELGLGDGAAPLLREIVDEDPSQVDAAILLAGILSRSGREEDLTELLARQLDAAKDRSDAASVGSLSLRLGALLERTRRSEARVVYYGALEWQPQSKELLRALVSLRDPGAEEGDRADAMERLLALETGLEAEAIAIELAALRESLGDEDAAGRAFEAGFRAHPSSALLRERLEAAYRAREEWTKLAELWVIDASVLPDAKAVPRLREAAAMLRRQAGEPGRAADVLRAARAMAKEDLALLDELVATLLEAGDKAGATLELTLAIDWFGDENPDGAGLHAARSELRRDLDDDDGALTDLEQAYLVGGAPFAKGLVIHLQRMAARASDARDAARARALRVRLAEVLPATGAADEARALLADLLKSDSKDRDALRALAHLEATAGHWDAASATYRRLVALEEGELVVDTALRLADACERAGRLGDARGGLERARRVAPGNEALSGRLERLYQSTGAFRELAELYLEEAKGARDVAGRFTSLVRAGTLILEHGADPSAALGPLREANALRPGDLECTARLAEGLALAGKATEATDLLNGVLGSYKGRRSRELASIHHAFARVARALGNPEGEVQWLTSALDMDAQDGEVASELAVAARRVGQLDLATRALRTVTMLKIAAPMSRAMAYQHLGEIAHDQGDVKRAVMMLKRAVDDDPSLDGARSLLEQLKAE